MRGRFWSVESQAIDGVYGRLIATERQLTEYI